MTQSGSSKGHGGESFFEQDLIKKAVHGNDWRGLNPAQIGEGEFFDRVTVILPN